MIVLAGLLPLLFTPLSLGRLSDMPVALAYVVVLYSTMRLSKLLLIGREALIDATFWIFVYVFFGLAALAQTTTGTYALPPYGPFTTQDHLGAFGVIIVGIFSYELGRFLARISRRGHGARSGTTLLLVPKRIWVVAAVGLATTIGFVLVEGLHIQFSSRQDATVSLLGAPGAGMRLDQISDKALGLIKIFFRWVPPFVALYLLLQLRTSFRYTRARVPYVTTTATRLLLTALVIANSIVNNPISNPRSRFGGVAMALTLAVMPLRTPKRFRIAVSAILLSLLFLYPIADAFRYDKREFTSAPLSQDLVSSPDYSMFQQELNAQVYVRANGHTMGHQLLGSLFVVVPRRWWPTKPIATGDLISRTNVINASDSLWSEAYVDFGMIGVIGFFFVYGRLSFAFEQAYMERRPGSLSAVSIFVPLFAAFQLLILRGALQPIVGELAPVALLVLACGRRNDRHRAPLLKHMGDPT